MIPYTTFRVLLSDVQDCYTFDLYCAECGGSIPTDDPAEAQRILSAIWAMARDGLTIKSIADACDISMLSLAQELGISRRTIGDWSTGLRTPPAWQLPLIAYAAINLYPCD